MKTVVEPCPFCAKEPKVKKGEVETADRVFSTTLPNGAVKPCILVLGFHEIKCEPCKVRFYECWEKRILKDDKEKTLMKTLIYVDLSEQNLERWNTRKKPRAKRSAGFYGKAQ